METILYLSNGYPSLQDSSKIAEEYIDAGCKIIEIDFPSRNPYLEGEYIASRMQEALNNCSDYAKYMEEMVKLKTSYPEIKFIVLAYEDTIQEIGLNRFKEFLIKNKFFDLILVGSKNACVKEALIQDGIRVANYVQYQMIPEEIENAKKSNGFVYLQAKPMEGQGYVNPEYPTLKDCIAKLRSEGINRPIYCGVGLRDSDDIKMVREAGGDAAFIGSTILKLHGDIPKMKEKIREFVEAGKTH